MIKMITIWSFLQDDDMSENESEIYAALGPGWMSCHCQNQPIRARVFLQLTNHRQRNWQFNFDEF